MPNKYSQLYSSPFVPTYAPPNTQLIQQAGQNLWKRQKAGAEKYDAIGEALSSVDVLEQDKQLINKKRSEIEGMLSQYSDENDFIDAMPALRRAARNVTEDLSSGKLAKAVRNKQNALETFEKIEDSDWSQQDKEKMKEMYLQGYTGAESDKLDVFAPPKYVDVQSELEDRVSDLDKVYNEKIGLIPDDAGNYYKGKIKTEGRNIDDIKSTVASTVYGNEQVYNALRQEAIIKGEDPETYVRDKANVFALDLADRWGEKSKGVSNIQWDDGAVQVNDINAFNKVAVQPGSVRTENLIPDYESYMDKIDDMSAVGNQEQVSALKNGMAAALSSMVKQGELTTDEYDYFINNLGKKRAYAKSGFSARSQPSVMPGFAAIQGKGEESVDNRMRQIGNKVKNYIDENEGLVSTNFPIRTKKQQDAVDDVFRSVNPSSMALVSQDVVDEKDLDSEKKKNEYMSRILREGELQGIDILSENAAPLYRFSVPDKNEDGETIYRTVMVQENKQPNQAGERYETTFEAIARTAYPNDNLAKQIADHQKLFRVPVSGENVKEYLPPDYGARMPEHVSLKQHEDGIELNLGEEESHKPVTYERIFNGTLLNLHGKGKQKLSEPEIKQELQTARSLIEGLTTLTETEKNSIIDNMGNLRNVPQSTLQKMYNEFRGRLYKFDDKIEALNFAKQ